MRKDVRSWITWPPVELGPEIELDPTIESSNEMMERPQTVQVLLIKETCEIFWKTTKKSDFSPRY